MAMDFPVSPVDRLPIFPDEACSAAALMELIGGVGRGEEESANGSRGAVVCEYGRSSAGRTVGAAAYGDETSAAGAPAMSGFSESEGNNSDAIEHGGVEGNLHGDHDAVIQDQAESGDGGSAQSTGKVDPQAPGWTKRVRIGNQPPDRAPCPERVGALEQTIRGYADKLGDHVVESAEAFCKEGLPGCRSQRG